MHLGIISILLSDTALENFVPPIFESVHTPARIIPYPTGRPFWGGGAPGTSCQATIMLSLRDEIHSAPRL
jgi:hypothetical protein